MHNSQPHIPSSQAMWAKVIIHVRHAVQQGALTLHLNQQKHILHNRRPSIPKLLYNRQLIRTQTSADTYQKFFTLDRHGNKMIAAN